MKKVYNLQVVLLIFIWCSLSCSSQKSESVNVTYSLSIDSDEPYRVFIAYRDSSGYETLYTDKAWSKDVRLSSGYPASLLVVPQDDIGLYGESACLLTGQVVSGRKSITNRSRRVLSISMMTKK